MNLPTLPRTERTFKSGIWPTTIRYRAFTAGQQSLLLQVADANTDDRERADAMNQLFSECVEAGVPFNQLPIGVVEETFIRIRSTSIGEIMKIRYLCKKDFEEGKDGVCGQEIVVPIPLTEVLCSYEEGFKDVFDLPGGYHIKMRQPSFSDVSKLSNAKTIEDMVAGFIQCLYDDDGQVWEIKDPDETNIEPQVAEERARVKQEFVKWVGDNIEDVIIADISENFFGKIPRIRYSTKIKCPKCKGEHEIKFNGLNEIFI